MEKKVFASGRSQEEIVAIQSAQDPEINFKTVYYESNGVELSINVYCPNPEKYPGVRPGVLFFFGGGFHVGTPLAFREQAKVCANQGYVAFSADYRISSLYNVTSSDSMRDGAAAWRFIYTHAAQWDLDPERIILAGGSAGGTIASMCGSLTGIHPAGVVLFNPGIRDNDQPQELMCRLTEREVDGVPVTCITNIPLEMPPLLVMHGEEDQLIPITVVRRYVENAKKQGIDATLITYPKASHGFFNFNRSRAHFMLTMGELLLFMEKRVGMSVDVSNIR